MAAAKAELTEAVTKEEWLQAARLSLGLASTDDLHLLEVKEATTTGDGSEDLEGFIGETLPVKVRVRVGNDGEEKEARLFLKVVPQGNATRSALAVGTGAFRKESGYYEMMERLSPRLSPNHQLPAPWAPRCFLARETALVFEDLAVQGYKTLGTHSTLDFEHCAAALDAVARLHAATIALEETDEKMHGIDTWHLDDNFNIFQEILFTPVPNILSKGFFLNNLKCIETFISLSPEYKDSPHYQEILQKMVKLPDVAYQCVKPSEKYRNVVLHGDMWRNNMMFRYSAQGQVAEAKLVDFQLTRYGPPALDVEMLLGLALRKELREARGDELRDIYYAALRGALLRAGVDPDVLMPREHFDACRRQGEVLGRIAGAVYCLTVYMPAQVTHEVYKSSDALRAFLEGESSTLLGAFFFLNNSYRKCVGDFVKELVDKVILADNFGL